MKNILLIPVLGLLFAQSVFSSDLVLSHKYLCINNKSKDELNLVVYKGGLAVGDGYTTMYAKPDAQDKMNVYTGEVSRSFFGSNYAAADIPVAMIEESAESATIMSYGYMESARYNCKIVK